MISSNGRVRPYIVAMARWCVPAGLLALLLVSTLGDPPFRRKDCSCLQRAGSPCHDPGNDRDEHAYDWLSLAGPSAECPRSVPIMNIGHTIDDVLLLVECSPDGEWEDQVQ
jgi:hypothetical protein